MYADVYIRVRSGPYRGAFRVYERFTTYEVSEEGVQETDHSRDIVSANCLPGSRALLDPDQRAGEGIPNGQAKEEGKVNALDSTVGIDGVGHLHRNRRLTDQDRGFCGSCGASIPHRNGEGRCPKCAHHNTEVEAVEQPPAIKEHEEWCSGEHGECNCGQNETSS